MTTDHTMTRIDRDAVLRIAAEGGTWDDVLAAAAANAPHDLMVYAVIDADELLSLAGHSTRAVEYLLGNHTIAETMFRLDPRALLCAPLRVLVYGDANGDAVFTMDKPSTAFGSLGIAAVTEVGLGPGLQGRQPAQSDRRRPGKRTRLRSRGGSQRRLARREHTVMGASHDATCRQYRLHSLRPWVL